jgi:hypothetical protein
MAASTIFSASVRGLQEKIATATKATKRKWGIFIVLKIRGNTMEILLKYIEIQLK